jgi:hypothetical protein
MRRLLGVELTRLRWRRAVVVLLAACFVIPALLWATTVYDSRPVSAQDVAEARAMVGQDTFFQREVARCVKHPGRYGLPSTGEVAQACDQQVLTNYVGFREALNLKAQTRLGGVGIFVVMAGLLVLMGATFAGADWNSGSMSNQLLFESRRLRVFAAKGLAVLLVGLVVSGLVAAAWWLGLGLVARQRGIDGPAGIWHVIGWQVVRGTLLAGAAGLGGYALTMFFRSTVATLGVLFGSSVSLGILFGALAFPGAQRWNPATNVNAWLQDGTRYFDQSLVENCDPNHFSPAACNGLATLSMWGGGVYLLVLLGLLLLIAGTAFGRRDVP